MTGTFGRTSTTEDVLSGIDLRGKRILVTGVSAGIGVETARPLAAHGAQVIGAARDLAKAENATEQVRRDATTGGGSFDWSSSIWPALRTCVLAPTDCWRKGNLST